MSNRLVMNSLSGGLLYVTSIAIAFVMSPVLIRALGNHNYGLWETVISVVGYMGLLDLGIGSALVRFVSVADGKKDSEDLQETISTALMFFLTVGVISMAIFLSLSRFPHVVARRGTEGIGQLPAVLVLLGIDAAILFPLQVFIASLLGLQHHSFVNLSRALLSTARAVVTFRLLRCYPASGLLVIALLEPVFTLFQFVLFAGRMHYMKDVPKISLAKVTRRKLRDLFSFGARSATMLVAGRLQNQSVPLIIGNAISMGSVIYFVIPNRLVDYGRGAAFALGFPLAPYFGAQLAKDDPAALRARWLQTAQALLVVTMAMPPLLFFLGERFISVWIGPDIAKAGHYTLLCLTAGLAVQALTPNAYSILSATAKHGSAAVVWLVVSILSVPAGIVGGIHWGVTGVAVATTVPIVVGSAYSLMKALRELDMSLSDYLYATVRPLILPLTCLAAVLSVMNGTLRTDSLIVIGFKAACRASSLGSWAASEGWDVVGQLARAAWPGNPMQRVLSATLRRAALSGARGGVRAVVPGGQE